MLKLIDQPGIGSLQNMTHNEKSKHKAFGTTFYDKEMSEAQIKEQETLRRLEHESNTVKQRLPIPRFGK